MRSLEPTIRGRVKHLLLIALLLWVASPASAGPVLGPGQSSRVRQAVGEAGPLAAGWSLDEWRIEADRVVIRLEGPTDSASLTLLGEARDGAVKTRHGWLHGDGVPSEVTQVLVRRLNSAPRLLEWRDAQGPEIEASRWTASPDRARAARERVQRRRASRMKGGAPDETLESLSPIVEQAFERLLAGDLAAARSTLESANADPAAWAPGGLSVWLAAGGEPSDRLVSIAERSPWEPRVHALLARQARREGRLDEAAWRVDIALKLPLPDQLVLQEAEALGWSTAKAPSRSLPLPVDNERRSPWPWFVGGLLTCLGLILVGGHRRDLILVGATLMAVVIWWTLPTAPRGVEPPSIPVELVHPLGGGPCLATPAHHDGGGLRISVACDGVRHALMVSQTRPNWEAHGETAAHQISIVGDDEPSLEVVAAADVLVEKVKAVEADGYRVPVLRDGPAAVPTGRPAWLALEPETRAELEVVGALVCVAFFIALLTLFGVMRSVLGAWTVSESHRPWLLTAFVLAILLHGLAPDRMMMVYGGYDLAAHLIDGQVPRYGAGSVWFYGPPMWLLGSDHSWMQSLNRVAGLLCLLVAWDLGRLLWKKGEVPSAWILALLPVLWRGHTSESIVILPTLLVLLAMWHLASGSSRELGRALVLALAAATCRPEIALMAALIPLWWVAGGRSRPGMKAGLLLLAAAPLWLVHMGAIMATASSMASEGALPALQTPKAILGAMIWVGILANPAFTPVGFMPLCLWGGRAVDDARRALVTVLFALVWIASTGVDLTEVSVPRLHTGAALLVAPLVGVGWSELREWCGQRRYLWSAALAFWVAGLSWSAWQCFRPVNEDTEEALWRAAVSALPEEPGCLAVMGYGDPPPAGKTARHNPTYLLRGLNPGWVTYNLSGLPEMRQRCEGDSYVLLGVRCYADLREPPRPQPQGNAPLPICETTRATPGLQPLFEWRAENRGDLAYEMYPAGGPLTVGLYEFQAEMSPTR